MPIEEKVLSRMGSGIPFYVKTHDFRGTPSELTKEGFIEIINKLSWDDIMEITFQKQEVSDGLPGIESKNLMLVTLKKKKDFTDPTGFVDKLL